MNVLSQYITFLKEYKKLLERGVKDILSSGNSSNFIWIDDIENFVNEGVCSTTLLEIFSSQFKKQLSIFTLEKQLKPLIIIPDEFVDTIEFDEAKNQFKSIAGTEEDLEEFSNSEVGKKQIEKLKKFRKNKDLYSKLYRAYNDIRNDSNLEIVLSIGLIQYSKFNNNGNLSKTNQHLFHFPLSLNLDSSNSIKISFSEKEEPYADFFFLNNTPSEKEILSNIIDRFDQKISENGYEYIFNDDLIELLSKYLQRISSNSIFIDSIFKPEKDFYKEDYFRITYSPAINIKYKKPRFFEKLTNSIIQFSDDNNVEAKLFNLLIRNPEAINNNSYIKANYFIDELFEKNKSSFKHLNGADDFSVFFPLPFNKEQKQIYENYLKNRLTVVTGPPGTGKSHTIVNILCSLLAQGKRVLVTAQTDKALESLLDKIPETFDDLIFTKIQLETNQNRFSLEKSIGNISKILTDDFYYDTESKLSDLDNLKSEYVKIKFQIIHALEKEYEQITINDSFNNLRAFQVIEKFERKDLKEWSWIKDVLSDSDLKDFSSIKASIVKLRSLGKTEIKYSAFTDINITSILEQLENFDFKNYLTIKGQYKQILNYLNLTERNKRGLLKVNLDKIIEIGNEFSNTDIVVNSLKDLDNVTNQLNNSYNNNILNSNKSFSDLVANGAKYLLDIETYLSFSEQEKVGFFTRLKAGFKIVSYLEEFTINGKKCNTKTEIKLLKSLIENLLILNYNYTILQNSGYTLITGENSNLSEKVNILNLTLQKVQRNKDVISKIEFNSDFITFSDYTKINLLDINALSRKAILFKEELENFRDIESVFQQKEKILEEISSIIEKSSIRQDFNEFLPVDNIINEDVFEKLKNKFLEIGNKIKSEQEFTRLNNFVKTKLPNTFDFLNTVDENYITKENFEFFSASYFLKENQYVDFQRFTEELSQINNKIYTVKSEILFDLAKKNFKEKFSDNEIDAFINLLEQYRYNQSQSVRKIKNQTQYQIVTRNNGIEISKKLSCWVMKFNDVLNSIGNEPEIFDCIIVDEASQLDFNSLILSYYAENMIIVGDDKQTSPTSLTGADSNDFESIKNKYLQFLGINAIQIKSDNSLFTLSKMIAGASNLMLREHFRCVPEIIEFSKFHFYDNNLRPLKQINSNRLNPKEKVFVENAFSEEKVVNREIEEIKKFLKIILNKKEYSNKTIGVVSLGLTKHTEKLKDIKEELENEFGKERIDKHKIIIEDSPKFQGDERDVMIISLGVAIDYQKLQENQNAKPRAIISDQDEFKKINVALSRAKEQMILFHSVKAEHLQALDFRNKILNFFYEEPKPFPVLTISTDKIERYRHNVPKPFDSWFERDIAKHLIDIGFNNILPQYNVKEPEVFYNHKLGKNVYVNFKIDLVVINNGKMVAIECDGDPFHSLPEDVAYDIERQEFLERVGWKICRIVYSNYKRNPSEEIERIKSFVEINTKNDVQVILESETEFLVTEDIQGDIFHDVTVKYEDSENIVNADNQYKLEKKYKSYIDLIEDDLATVRTSSTSKLDGDFIEDAKSSEEKFISEDFEEEVRDNDKVLRYFNLFENNTYKVQDYEDLESLFSIAIKEKHVNGFLLQCYDNGHINKVNVKSILDKRLDYHYANGKNPNANLLNLKLIENESIIGLKIKKKDDYLFKAHKTKNISARDTLHLQGYKVIYQDFDEVKYCELPKNIQSGLERLVFESFSSVGKSIYNNYYDTEWELLKCNTELL